MPSHHWPALSYPAGADTYETLHHWTQIIGKVMLAFNPWVNHSWHTTLRVYTHGLTSGPIYARDKQIEIRLNLIDHELEITSSDDDEVRHSLEGLLVSGCYHHVMSALERIGVEVEINTLPCEMVDPPRFPDNHRGSYDREAATALHAALLQIGRVFNEYRSKFLGKSSEVMFFWGSFDLVVARFSGRTAPEHPGGFPNLPDWITREAYSHEVISCGFWPGDADHPAAAFYSYIYPAPEGYESATTEPRASYFDEGLGEFVLKYEDVIGTDDPGATLLTFMQSCYDTAAGLADWDVEALKFDIDTKRPRSASR